MPLHVFFPCFGTKTVPFLERESCIRHGVTLEYTKGWRMVPRKTWVLENFGPISKSRKRFLRVSKSRFRVFFCASESRIFLPTGLGVSDFFSFFVFVWFSEVEFFRVQGYILWKWASKLRQCRTIRILDYIYLLDHLLMTRVLRFPLTKKVVALDLKWRGVLFLK